MTKDHPCHLAHMGEIQVMRTELWGWVSPFFVNPAYIDA